MPDKMPLKGRFHLPGFLDYLLIKMISEKGDFNPVLGPQNAVFEAENWLIYTLKAPINATLGI